MVARSARKNSAASAKKGFNDPRPGCPPSRHRLVRTFCTAESAGVAPSLQPDVALGATDHRPQVGRRATRDFDVKTQEIALLRQVRSGRGFNEESLQRASAGRVL